MTSQDIYIILSVPQLIGMHWQYIDFIELNFIYSISHILMSRISVF